MDTAHDESDWENSIESGSSEDQEEIDFHYGGKAHRVLSSLEESIRKIDDFLSCERGFMLGDIVSSIKDPCGQMGKVIDVKMFMDLENVHGCTLREVNSKRILKSVSISEGDYVIHGPWLGKVNKVVERVTILFDDGAKCEVIAEDRDKIILTPVSPSLFEDSQFPYYVGQRVKIKTSNISKSARWLCGTWEGNRDEGTVFALEAGLVYVSWLASALASSEPNSLSPPCLQDPKNLVSFSCFPHELWQVGDLCICPFTNTEEFLGKNIHKASTLELENGYGILDREIKGNDRAVNPEEIFVISRIKTKIDVLWQDGSHMVGLDSKSLYPVSIVNAHEFWPGQFVLEVVSGDDNPCVFKDRRWGVVRSMDSKERTVQVLWRDLLISPSIEMKGLEETVSAYELVEHPDYSYCLGDVVFRVETNRLVDKTEEGKGDEADFETNLCCRDYNDNSSTCYLSSIGYVTGFKDGSVKVRWATGKTNKVAPSEIFRINEHPFTIPVIYEENVKDQERTEHHNRSLHEKGKESVDVNAVSLSLPRAAIRFFANITASLFGSCGSSSQSASFSSISRSCGDNEFEIPQDTDVLESQGYSTEAQVLVSDLQIGTHENAVFPFFPSREKPEQFKQFDVVSDCLDHHFVDSGLVFSQVKRDCLKKVQQEWSILEKDLPETIYVRFYEERMDLLRAAIVGAHGTPYQDGLFFFDIFLPPGYPHEAPLVHYNSGGLRLNPNLYESGKVCLSLLNTWTGTGTEVWNPGNSSILQVLLSLQALVLNEKPYFNEAGYEKQIGRAEGEKNSMSYNENAFLVTCKSMLYVLHKPPKHFEALVEEHFSRRARHILAACNTYMRGAPIGYASEDRSTGPQTESSCSTGFKIMLAKLLPKLVEGFVDKGIDCGQFLKPE